MAFDRSALGVKFLHVTANGKTTEMAVSSMTDAQITAALARPDNAGALAAGWTRSPTGAVVRAAAPKPEVTGGGVGAPAPSAPPVGAPPAASGKPTAAVGATPAGAPPTGTSLGGYMQVYEKGADGKFHVKSMLKSKMTSAQIASASKNGLNGVVATKPAATGGAAGGTTSTGTGDAAVGATSSTPAPTATTAAPVTSWVPPMVGMGGLNADPATGKIDWTKLLEAASQISAVDPQYASDLSNNILTAMQGVAPLQGEIQGLTSQDAATGKTKYQTLFDAQMAKFGQQQSHVFGNAASRGIGSSGMVNSSVADNNVANASQIAGYDQQFGNKRITDLLGQMTGVLGQQDQANTSAYYAALARQTNTLPTVAGAAGLG